MFAQRVRVGHIILETHANVQSRGIGVAVYPIVGEAWHSLRHIILETLTSGRAAYGRRALPRRCTSFSRRTLTQRQLSRCMRT